MSKARIPRVKTDKGNPGKGKDRVSVQRIEDLQKILRQEGVDDPFTALARIAKKAEKGRKLELAAGIYKELAQYILPKRRSVEMPPDMGPIIVRWEGPQPPPSHTNEGLSIEQPAIT